jgi:hypothetical protein
VTKHEPEVPAERVESIDPGLQLLYDHIKLTFIANAIRIAESQKPETLLKMIQTCKEIQPVDGSQKELWQIVQKVRHELLTRKDNTSSKPVAPIGRRTRKQK